MRPTSDTELINRDLASRSAKRALACVVLIAALLLSAATLAWASGTAQTLPFSQNWSTTTQINAPSPGDNNWSNVPGINGYLGGDISFTPGANPQTTTDDGAATGLNVKANQSNPNTLALGGVAEFDRSPTTNPVVALQPDDRADLPHLVMSLDTRNKKNVNVSYLLRDIDGSSDNAAQQIVLQYRVGTTGNYTNLPAGYVADATTGPSLATKETKVSVTLPTAAENQAVVQVRVGSANAVGTDEWVGVDDVSVSSAPTVSISGPASPNEGTTQTYNYTVSDTDSGDTFTPKSGFPDCGTGGTFVSGSLSTTASGGSFQCRFPDGPASPNVRVQGTDSRGLDSNTASQAANVQNVAPTVSLSGATSANEGETKTYDYTVTDPGQDAFTARSGFPDCGTGGTSVGTPTKTATGGSFQCRFPDGPASPGVRMQVADEDGANSNIATRSVAVANVAPTVTLNGSGVADEGQTKSYTYTITDPGDDPNPSVTESCGQDAVKTDTPEANDFRCRFPDGPASPTVSVTADDGDGANNSGAGSVAVRVSNVAPTATLNGDATADEGQTKSYAFKVSDPGDDTASFAQGFPRCGDNGRLEGTSAFGDLAFRCSFPDGPATTTAAVRVADSDGAEGNTAGRDVAVSNVAPTVRLEGPSAADEGQTKAYAYSVTDPGDDPNPSVAEDCGQGARKTDTPQENGFDCAFPDGPASPTVSVAATDQDGGRGDASVGVRVSNVAPTANADPAEGAYGTDEDANLQVGADRGLLSNDADRGADDLTARRVSGPARGGVEISDDGSFVYTPDANANGDDSFTYKACDEDGGCSAPVTVRVRVAAVNDAPVNDVPGPQGTNEDAPLVFSGRNGNAITVADPDDGRLSTTVRATGGTLELRNADGGAGIDAAVAGENDGSAVVVEGAPGGVSAALEGLRFAPEADRNGEAGVRVSTDDGGNTGSGGALTDEDAVAVAIEAVNDRPVAEDESYEAREDETLTVEAPGVLRNASDVDGDALSASVANGPARGGVEVSGDGSFAYTPDRDFDGDDAFTFRVGDGNGGSATGRASITVVPVNDAPVIDLNGGSGGTDHSATFAEDGGAVDAVDRDALSATDVDDSEIQSATVSLRDRPDGAAERLAADDSGTDVAASYDRSTGQLRLRGAAPIADYQKVLRTVTYENTSQDPSTADRELAFVATDGGAESGVAASTVTVRAVNDAPEISDIPDTATDEDTPTEDIPFTVRDVDTPADELTLSGSSGDARLVPDSGIRFGGSGGERTVRVDPAADRYGSVGISAEVGDGAASATDDFTLTIRDKTPPEAPSVDLEAESDTGASETDDVTNDPRPVFTGGAEAGAEVEVFDGEDRISTVTAEGGGWRYAVPSGMAFEDGEHRITATATDGAGNASGASEPLNVVVDRRAPDTGIDGSPHDPTDATAASFRFQSTEEGSTFECFVDDLDFEPCSSPAEYEDVSEGTHAFEVRAIDRAGNADQSPAMREWTVDRQAPSVSLTEPEDDALVGGEVGIAAEADDDLELEKVEFLVDGEVVDVDRTDAGREEPYEFGWDTTLEDDGEHEIGARATDAAGNVTSTDPRTVTTDNTAPDTIVDSSPNSPTKAANISFAFSAEDASSSFECSFDDREFVPCESPKEYPDGDVDDLTEGEHLFKVRAVDEAGNRDGSPAERVVVIDTQAPDAPAIESPGNESLDNDGAIEFSGTAEPGSRVRILEVSGGTVELWATARRTGESGRWDVRLAGVADGGHTYVAVATDAAGNESGRSVERAVTVDTAPPEVEDVVPHEDEADVPTNTDVKAIFSKRMDGGTLQGNFTLTRERDGSSVAVPATVTLDDETNTAVLAPDSELGYSETYTATVRGGESGVRDRADHRLAADRTWSFTTAEEPDTTAPDAPAIEEPAEDAHLDDGSFTLSGTAEPDSRVRIFDGGDRVQGGDVAGQDGAWSVDLADVSEGRHPYAATATDAAHNESERSAQRAVTVDLTAPDTVVEASPANPTNSTAANFRFRSNEAGAAFECSMDGEDFRRCSSPLGYRDLAGGEHVFKARAIDRAGNTDPSVAQRSFVVDTRAPEATLTSPAENALVRGEVGLEAKASDDRGLKRVEFLVDGEVVDSDLRGPFEFGWDSTLVGDGGHTVEVLVFDEAGNRTTSTPRRIRVDNTAPDTRITRSPELIINRKDATYEFISEDRDATFECRMDDGAFEDCGSPKPYNNLSDGRHLFSVRAVDEAGNRDDSPAERRLQVDTTAPDVRIGAAPQGTTRDRSARIEFSSEANAAFSCSLDGEEIQDCTSPVSLTGLSNGEHTFRVEARDAAGNIGAAQSSWTVDVPAPDIDAPTVAQVGPTGKKGRTRSVATAVFSERLDAATINGSTFRLVKGGSRKPVAATVSYDAAADRAILRPARPLTRGAVYTATLTTGVKDAAGNPLAANKVWRFKVR